MIKLKKQKSEDDKKLMIFINDHKKIIFVGIMIIYAIVMVICMFLIGATKSNLEYLYYISQIISGAFVIAGVAVAIIQYTFNSTEKRVDDEKQRKIEAAKLAKEFEAEIIPEMNELALAYRDKKLKDEIINYLDSKELNGFNRNELMELFPNEKYLEYRADVAFNYAIEKHEEFRKIVIEYNKKNNGEEEKIIRKKLDLMLEQSMQEVSGICNKLSNKLEYMAICFNTKIADETTVYQSLHSVFFMAVHMIYIYTFDSNVNERDRLFYNISYLYKNWKKYIMKK